MESLKAKRAKHRHNHPVDRVPSIEEFMPFIQEALNAVMARLHVAGFKYGEDVLFELEEQGAVTWVYTKAARLLWSFNDGQTREGRQDSYLDLAGYAILEMARHAYENGLETDGLFDRHENTHKPNPLDMTEWVEDPYTHEHTAVTPTLGDSSVLPLVDHPEGDPLGTATVIEHPEVVPVPPDLGPGYSERYWERAREEAAKLHDEVEGAILLDEIVQAENERFMGREASGEILAQANVPILTDTPKTRLMGLAILIDRLRSIWSRVEERV